MIFDVLHTSCELSASATDYAMWLADICDCSCHHWTLEMPGPHKPASPQQHQRRQAETQHFILIIQTKSGTWLYQLSPRAHTGQVKRSGPSLAKSSLVATSLRHKELGVVCKYKKDRRLLRAVGDKDSTQQALPSFQVNSKIFITEDKKIGKRYIWLLGSSVLASWPLTQCYFLGWKIPGKEVLSEMSMDHDHTPWRLLTLSGPVLHPSSCS